MRVVWWPLCLKGPDPDPCHTHIHIPTHSTPAPQHIPSHPITNQHTATPTIHFKTNFGDRFLRKKIPPVGCSVDTQPPSPFLVKVDEGICKCPSRAKKGTTHACLLRACHYSTLIHLGEGWPGIKNMDHWWYLFSQKPEREISAFLEANIRAYLLPGPYI